MIRAQRQLFYFVGDKPYASLEEAQKADLISLMESQDWTQQVKEDNAAWVMKYANEIVDTITTTPRSRLRARKLHGATRKPKAKPAPSNEKT